MRKLENLSMACEISLGEVGEAVEFGPYTHVWQLQAR
jgi:hypothetical protein